MNDTKRGTGRTSKELSNCIMLAMNGRKVAFLVGQDRQIEYTKSLCCHISVPDEINRNTLKFGDGAIHFKSILSNPISMLCCTGTIHFDHAALEVVTGWKAKIWHQLADGCAARFPAST